jgi:tetratricopeptide (TPR) repeat protein
MHLDRRDVAVGLILFASSLAVFAASWRHDFSNWDDPGYVIDNPNVSHGLSGDGIAWAFTSGLPYGRPAYAANWHPLTWLSLQLDSSFFGTRPRGFHLTNVLLHSANTALLFWLLRSLTGAVWRSVFVSVLFAFHPLHVESVAWVAERKDVLSTLFWLTTCLAYGWYAARPEWARYSLAVFSLLLGLMAKPMLVTLPFVLLLLDFWPLERLAWNQKKQANEAEAPIFARPYSARLLVIEKIPFLVLAAGSCFITWHAQQSGHAVRSLEHYPLSARLENALVSYWTYLGQAVWPVHLGLFYPHPVDLSNQGQSVPTTALQAAAAGLGLIVVTVLVCSRARRFPYLPVGWLWYLGTLVPVIGVIQVGIAAHADRYTYVPLIGIFIAVVWGAGELAKRWHFEKAMIGLGIAVSSVCVVLCWLQLNHWENSVTIWQHTLAACGESTTGHIQLAEALRADHPGAAVEQFRQALRLDPNNPIAYRGLGAALVGQGKIQEAVREYEEGLRRNPEAIDLHYYLGLALVDLGQKERAAREQEKALQLNPDWTPAHRSLGLLLYSERHFDSAIPHLQAAIDQGLVDHAVYYALGRMLAMRGSADKAAEYLYRAVSLQPQNWTYRALLGLALAASGRTEAAREQFQQASRLNPIWLETLNRHAWTFATDPDSQKRNSDLALQLAEAVCHATSGQEARFLDTLAAAYAEGGRFPRAIETAQRASTTAGATHQESFANEIKSRLKLYEQGKPFRSTAPPTKGL